MNSITLVDIFTYIAQSKMNFSGFQFFPLWEERGTNKFPHLTPLHRGEDIRTNRFGFLLDLKEKIVYSSKEKLES